MKYLWTEDTGAGLHFWELVNQLFFDDAFVIESKGSNQGLLDALSDIDMKEDDKYYIAFDYVVDNQDNLDLFKLFFSKKCILFEGISEELLIRSYIDSKETLSDIEVLSFHKGFKKIMNIWKKVNEGSGNKLGIVRDYDNQPKKMQ